jgi:hypothetical protein
MAKNFIKKLRYVSDGMNIFISKRSVVKTNIKRRERIQKTR